MKAETQRTRQVLAVMAAVLFGGAVTVPAVLYVDVNWTGAATGTASQPYTSIRDAVTDGSSTMVYIADGTYDNSVEAFSTSGHIAITTGLTLEAGYVGHTGGGTFDWGTRTVKSTIVDLGSAGDNRAFYSTSGTAPVLDGFTFQNANNSQDGGAVFLGTTFSQGGVVQNSLFKDNVTTGLGGGLYMHGNNDVATLTNVEFSGNQAANGGGVAINVPDSNTTTLTNVVFTGNQASSNGGGLYVTGGDTFTVTGATFTGNSANDGGAISNQGGTLVMSLSSITGNIATGDSAIDAWSFQDTNVLLENVLIADNTSTGGGYAVEVGSNAAGDFAANFVTMANNSGAGAINVHEKGSAKDERLILTNSIIYGDGTGIGINTDTLSSTFTLDYNDVFNFLAPYGGTAIGQDTNSLLIDPMFLDPDTGEYTLRLDSLLINAANPGATLLFDLLGDVRPQNGNFAMGAFETGILVPEPTSVAMLAFAALALLKRRRD